MPLTVVENPVPLRADGDGVMRVGGTRVMLDTLVAAFHEGATAEEMVQQYPSLKLGDVYSAIGYYLNHQPEVDAYLLECERVATRVREENEKRFNPVGIRARLIARRAVKSNGT